MKVLVLTVFWVRSTQDLDLNTLKISIDKGSRKWCYNIFKLIALSAIDFMIVNEFPENIRKKYRYFNLTWIYLSLNSNFDSQIF